MKMKINLALAILCALVAFDVLLRLGTSQAHAQSNPSKRPIDLTVATTRNGNYLLYRMWSDGSIDVRLTNPARDQLTFQEGWRAFQKGP